MGRPNPFKHSKECDEFVEAQCAGDSDPSCPRCIQDDLNFQKDRLKKKTVHIAMDGEVTYCMQPRTKTIVVAEYDDYEKVLSANSWCKNCLKRLHLYPNARGPVSPDLDMATAIRNCVTNRLDEIEAEAIETLRELLDNCLSEEDCYWKSLREVVDKYRNAKKMRMDISQVILEHTGEEIY
jgi:hypothetical protein